MRVTERHRERVGLVFAKRSRRRKKSTHHESDLVLRCRALANDRKLHLGRRVFVNIGATLARREENHPADVSDQEG